MTNIWLTPYGLDLLSRCKRAKEAAVDPVDPNDTPDPDDNIERLTVSVAATVPESEVPPEESKPEPEPLLSEIELAVQKIRQREEEEARLRRIKVFGPTGQPPQPPAASPQEPQEELHWGGPGAHPFPPQWGNESGPERAQRQLLERTGAWPGYY
jgi:hypothetical protein